MQFSRRGFFLGSTAVIAAGGAVLSQGGLRNWFLSQIAGHFDVDARRSPAVHAFIDDFIAAEFAPGGQFEGRDDGYFRLKPWFLGDLAGRESVIRTAMVKEFVVTTNILQHREDGVPLEYFGPNDPYANPCMNQLTAYALRA